MGGVGDSIEVTGDGDRDALHAAIWSRIEAFLEMYASGTDYRQVWSYLGESIAAYDDVWRADGDHLSYMFKDFAGCCSRSANLWAHWTQLALASEWDALGQLAEEHDLAITSPERALATHLVDGPGYVTLRNDVWSADEAGLSGDSQHIPLAELTDEERVAYDVARTRCMCGPCKMLRPEPPFETGILSGLVDADAAPSAAWYVARWSRSSPAILAALLTAASDDALRAAIEAHAPRVPGAWSQTVALLPALRGAQRGRALYALASIPLDDATRAELLRYVRDTLTTDDDLAAEAAVEVAGLIGRNDLAIADQVAAVLDRDVSDELRHQAVLGLVNLHLERPASGPVRARLEREATKDTEAGKLAAWFLASF